MHTPHRRFGSAHALALVALFVALAGGAYAASQAAKNSVTSRSVRNGSLTGNDVKNNSLTGKDVKESTLGRVRRAQSAQSATSFTGVRKIDFRDNQTGQAQTILSFRGMDLRATCSSLGGNVTALALDLTTTSAAAANSTMQRAAQPSGPDPVERDGETPIVRGAALGAGGTMAVIPGPPSPDNLSDGSGPGGFIQDEGQIVYRSDTDVITVVFHAFADYLGSGTGYCEVLGDAIAQ